MVQVLPEQLAQEQKKEPGELLSGWMLLAKNGLVDA
jgi:hypothetical protein